MTKRETDPRQAVPQDTLLRVRHLSRFIVIDGHEVFTLSQTWAEWDSQFND
jgi:hypothetical protein